MFVLQSPFLRDNDSALEIGMPNKIRGHSQAFTASFTLLCIFHFFIEWLMSRLLEYSNLGLTVTINYTY